MDPPRTSRLLDPAMAAITKHKAEAIRLAKEQAAAVQEMCRRAKSEAPPYEFEELIGKGAYGRVYKGHQLPSQKLVAIKVMDIDSIDYRSVRDFRDESIKDFIHETKVMKQVKDAGAKNINEIIEAISIHSQLWLVCEYCPGGSVRTLMRATGDKLDEKFIIPIARELAEGLRAIHAAGIIHRDVKAANILIHEEGRLQICDFGVAGILQTQLDKRSTWIGTPHWMPPEMFATRGEAHQYGSEIDVWAYGCTLFEFATGNPPNSGLRERMQIGRQLNRSTPKLDGDRYSESLRDLVGFALESDPATRPTMGDILSHSYIQDSEEEYPISSVSELVRIYYQWSQRGGQRISLFHPGGAAAAEFPGVEETVNEDWNFSTTDGFERRFSVIDLDQLAAELAELEEQMGPVRPNPERNTPEELLFSGAVDLTPVEQANFDERVRRGAAAMEGLFNEDMPSYKYETKNDFVPIEPKPSYSDLPLRTETDRSSVTSTFIDIDIGSFDSSHYAAGSASAHPFQLADADTIRANRSSGRTQRNSSSGSRSRSSSRDAASVNLEPELEEAYQPPSGPRPPTMDWKFPTFMVPAEEDSASENAQAREEEEEEARAPDQVDPTDKRATMEWTFPVMTASADEPETGEENENNNASESLHEDTLRAPLTSLQQPLTARHRDSIGEPGDSRPSTAASNVSSSASDTDYDPFRFDRPATPPGGSSEQHGHFFDNAFPEMMESSGYADFEPSSVLDGPGPDEEDSNPVWQHNRMISDPSIPPHEASSSFPTVLPSKGLGDHLHPARESVIPAPLATARRRGAGPVRFPDLVPPSIESLAHDADDQVVTAELDRLLGDFLDALSATGEALSRFNIDRAE
ncbi:hypothetical protein ASPZODRAFT_64892 [Penicilliopsis zonata CBS 506.65]|uniref:non-specific serine/threonine protein kinase n=1 Tax=Penicilliopsis zonata CBS 506.65 TaxID=1073090 RepID=A0A1L9SJ64_9EURO|nr:hypothetical protein ASPZODRAFT_64892 [Penicilliopsis zonata CBS 506.65]OJJ47238.1 hypothetical protein ASPZODRAFT_64892 [Penicilliopsis zonata CBS 506.65]